MKQAVLLFSVIIFLSIPMAAALGQPLEGDENQEAADVIIDLAVQDPGTTDEQRIDDEREIRILIRNMVEDSQAAYQVSIDREDGVIPPLPFDSFQGSGEADRTRILAGTCAQGFFNELKEIKEEKEVAALVARRRASCTTDRPTLEEAIRIRTQRSGTLAPAGCNTVFTIKVERMGDPQRMWIRRLPTSRCGEWRTSYGFTFVPDRDDRFFTDQVEDDPTSFIVRQEDDREDLDFLPSVLFHWHPAGTEGGPGQYSWVAGLGYDLDRVALFGGLGWTYRQNVTLSLGVAIHQREVLDGRYDLGQQLKENLDAAQLTETTYGANVYFGIGFRFGENIFDRRAEIQRASAQAADQAAAAAKQKQAAAAKQKELAEAEDRLGQANLEKCQQRANAEAVQSKNKCDGSVDSCVAEAEAKRLLARAECRKDFEERRVKRLKGGS